MFEVRLLVEDKKLSEVLWLLDGKIAEPPQLIPVRNATIKRVVKEGVPHTKVTAEKPTEGSVANRIDKAIADRGLTQITHQQIKQLCVDVGSVPESAPWVIQKLMAASRITRQGRGEYSVRLT